MPAAFIEKSPSLSSDGLPFNLSSTMLNDSPTPCSPGPCIDSDKSPPVASVCTCQCPRWSRPRQWIYRGEGNASVVLALPQKRKIVRLAKIDQKLRRMDSDAQFSDASGVRTIAETLERLVFSEKILGPLLGADLVKKFNVYHIDADELDEIARELDKVRPAHRKHKRLAPVCHVIECDDCTVLPGSSSSSSSSNSIPFHLGTSVPVFCIEIKPKQGFLAEGHQRCPFCLNQFLKRKHGKIDALSQYCPLDLFSGSRYRMLRAVGALTRTPQNNLRIFQDGDLVFADECQTSLTTVLERWFQLDEATDRSLPLLKHFCALIVDALTAQLPDSTEKRANGEPIGADDWSCLFDERDHFAPCESAESPLPNDCVLSRLLRVQSFGNVQFKKLYEAYDALADRMRCGNLSYERLRWTDPQMNANWLATVPQEDVEVHTVQRYRISSTTRDCSIMITFQTLSDGENYPLVVRDLSGRSYKCHASVVDVDPKPAACVEKHRRRDMAMNEAFNECRLTCSR